jgi:excisionase family DNA binding protein
MDLLSTGILLFRLTDSAIIIARKPAASHKEIVMEDQRMLTVAEASTILEMTDRHVRRLCQEHKLQAEKDGKSYQIPLDAVLAWKANGETVEDEEDIEPEDADMSADKGHTPEQMSEPKKHFAYENGHLHTFEDADPIREDTLDISNLTDSDIISLFEKCTLALDDSVIQVKDVLATFADGFITERSKTHNTQETLSHLLDQIK